MKINKNNLIVGSNVLIDSTKQCIRIEEIKENQVKYENTWIDFDKLSGIWIDFDIIPKLGFIQRHLEMPLNTIDDLVLTADSIDGKRSFIISLDGKDLMSTGIWHLKIEEGNKTQLYTDIQYLHELQGFMGLKNINLCHLVLG